MKLATDTVIQRCRSIRWLLAAHPHVPKSLALGYIIEPFSIIQNCKKLLQNYKKELKKILFTMLPNSDCVDFIIEHGDLVGLFCNKFNFISLDAKKTQKIKFYTKTRNMEDKIFVMLE